MILNNAMALGIKWNQEINGIRNLNIYFSVSLYITSHVIYKPLFGKQVLF